MRLPPRRTAFGACLIAAALASCAEAKVEPTPMAGADPSRGRTAIAKVGCGACHLVPGVPWPEGRVGPSLEGFGERSLIAGRFPNEPEVLSRFVRDAPALSPGTAMPPMPLTEQEARDVAAYLLTLGSR